MKERLEMGSRHDDGPRCTMSPLDAEPVRKNEWACRLFPRSYEIPPLPIQWNSHRLTPLSD
ncbi:hypothetical protein RISK_004447 [Rhodopirellula islandica]|uniref:Uncharacterized protein n=1 Tax=Rhodopirellula islandica TaxID=595434 RepID=A0A0J1B9Z0_RHOIS|nr:hypothetical protein RISK_004447 [Rhodopirellula islandica]